MVLKGDLDQERLRSKSAAITSLDEQIKKKESELIEVHAKAREDLGRPKPIAVCSCGAEVFEGAKFCGKVRQSYRSVDAAE